MRQHIRLSSTAIAVSMVFIPPQLVAQQNSAAEEQKQPTDNTEVIMVTAQRRSQSLQEVPVSLTVVDEKSLEARAINDVRQLNLAAPSVQIAGGTDADSNIFIRGVGTPGFAPTIESSVAIAVDDVTLGRANLAFGAFDDVQRIEALSGPQGLLFGKNASAGLLNVITHKPELGEFSGKLESEMTYRDTTPDSGQGLILRGTVNMPVGEDSALRINARFQSQDTIAQNLYPDGVDADAEDQGIRLKFLSEVSDDLDIYVIGEYAERTGQSLFTYRQADPNGGIAESLIADNIQAGPENLVSAADADSFSDRDLFGLQATVNYRLDNDWEISNIAAYKSIDTNSNLDADRLSIDLLNINSLDGKFEQFSNEFRVIMDQEQDFRGQFGVYYYSAEEDARRQLAGTLGIPSFVAVGFPFCVGAEQPFGTPPESCPGSNFAAIGRDIDSLMEWQSLAAFGQFDYDVSEDFSLLFGARLTRDEVSLDTTQQQASYFVPLASEGDFSDELSDTQFNWKLGGQYQLTKDAMLYGYFATGYKGPGFNSAFLPGIDTRIESETSDAVELGVKTTWLDRKVVFNLSAFYQTFENYQAQSFDTVNQTFKLQNAGELKSQGMELLLRVNPTDNFTLSANATLLDATFEDFQGVQCYPGQPDCPNDVFDASGQPLPGSADFTSTIQGSYTFNVSNNIYGFLDVNWYHRSEVNYDLSGSPLTEVGAINPVGFSLGFENEYWRVSLFCQNCFDDVYATNVAFEAGDANEGLATTFQSWSVASVRNWGVRVSYEFY